MTLGDLSPQVILPCSSLITGLYFLVMPARKPSGIAQWPADERPRERLLSRGAHALTDAEVIAILLRVGVKGKNAVELGRDLLQRFGVRAFFEEAPVIHHDKGKEATSRQVAGRGYTAGGRRPGETVQSRKSGYPPAC